MPFLDELEIRVEPSQEIRVTLTARLRYVDRYGRLFTVPEGFTCDLSSLPWWLRMLPSSTSWAVSGPAGALHDAGYRHFSIWLVPRKEMDLLYQDALIECGAKPWRAKIQRIGLRLGGWRAWRRWRRTHPSKKGPTPPPVDLTGSVRAV